MAYDDDSGAPVWVSLSQRVSVALKAYRCDNGCGQGIVPGSMYERTVGLLDGVLTTGRRHVEFCYLYDY